MEDNLADAKRAKSSLSKAALKDQMDGISTFGLGDYTVTDSGRMYPPERKVNLDTDMFPSFKKDIDNKHVAAENIVVRTLSTNNQKLNENLWKLAGYENIPTVQENIEELANSKFSHRIIN